MAAMIRGRAHRLQAAAITLLLLTPLAASRGATRVEDAVSTRALRAALAARGRLEADVRVEDADPVTGRTQVTRGVLALEAPRFASLRFGATGEALTLRADGGDWLQPKLHQLVRAGPRSAAAGLRWWGVLADAAAPVRERALGGGRFALVPEAGDSSGIGEARLTLDAAGMPARLEIVEAGSPGRVFRLTHWKRVRPRGARAFHLEPPHGYEVVELP
jgi:hypothetical protein